MTNRKRMIRGKKMSVGEASELERASLLPFGEEGFLFEDVIYPLIADGHARVKVKAHWYSAAVPPGARVAGVTGPAWAEIKYDNRCVAKAPALLWMVIRFST